MKRFFQRIAIHSIVLTAIYGSLAIFFLISTNAGLEIILYATEKFFIPNLKIENTYGSLIKTITLEGISYEDDNYTLHAKEVYVDFSLREYLFEGKKNFENLSLKDVEIKSKYVKATGSFLDPIRDLNEAIFYTQPKVSISDYAWLFNYKFNFIDLSNIVFNDRGKVYHINSIKNSLSTFDAEEKDVYHNTFHADASIASFTADIKIERENTAYHFNLDINDAKLTPPADEGVLFLANLDLKIEADIDLYNNKMDFQVKELIGDINGNNIHANLSTSLKDNFNPSRVNVKAEIGSNLINIEHTNEEYISSQANINLAHINEIIPTIDASLVIDSKFKYGKDLDTLIFRASAKNLFGLNGFEANLSGDSKLAKGNINTYNQNIVYSSKIKTSFEEAYNLKLEQGNLFVDTVGEFSLSPIELNLDKNFKTNNFCITNKDSKVCVNGEMSRQSDWSINILGDKIPVGMLNNIYPLELNLHGTLNFDTKLQGTTERKIFGSVSGKMSNVQIDYEDYGIESYKFPIRDAEFAANIDGSLSCLVKVHQNKHNFIKSEFKLTPKSSSLVDTDISGYLDLNLTDLKNIYTANLSKINTGKFKSSIKFGGTLEDPDIQIDALLQNLDLHSAEYGTTLKVDTIQVKHIGDEKSVIKGTGTLGDGKFHIAGNSKYKALDQNFNFNIIGDKLIFLDNTEYYVKASPNLNISMTPKKIVATGNISLFETKIDISNEEDVQKISSDVVVIEEEPFISLPGLYTDLNLITDNPIEFRGWDLEAKLLGTLRIKHVPNNAPVADGYLKITEGSYNIYDNVFNISDSRLMFPGTLLYNPNLNIRAILERDIDKLGPLVTDGSSHIKVGANITGSLYRAKIKLYSEPTMEQSDIISYLTTGHTSEKLQKNVGSVLINKISSYFINERKLSKDPSKSWMPDKIFIVNNDETSLLSDSDLSTSNEDDDLFSNSKLALYKRIRKNMFVVVELGNKQGAVKLKYLLNDHWTAEANASNSSVGIDMLYSIERD